MRVNLPRVEAQEVGRPHFRVRGNPIRTGILYQFRQPFYDYYGVTVATALTQQRLFTIPFGQQYTPAGGAALTKTIWHTNMTQSGTLPSPQKLYVKAISLHLANDVAANDLTRFVGDTVLTFLISGRDYLQLHAAKFPAQGGAYGFSAIVASNGLPVADNDFKTTGALGEVVEQLQTFAVDLDPTRVVRANAGATYTTLAAAAGGTQINAHVYLDGLFSREVN